MRRIGEPCRRWSNSSSVQAVTGLKILFPRRLGEAIPGTDQLAVVAAVDPVADQRPQLLGDGALVLDGEVGDAAAGIQLVGAADRLCRADVDAAFAGSTMILFRKIYG